MAIASLGFCCAPATPAEISVDGVIGFWEPLKIPIFFFGGVLAAGLAALFELAHVKDRLGHHIFLAGPVAKVAVAAAFAAKRKIRVRFGVGRHFANRTTMFHRTILCAVSELCVRQSTSNRRLPSLQSDRSSFPGFRV